MLDGLLKEQIRGDPCIAEMLTRYNGTPAFFYQRSPQDTDERWSKPTFPRIDYNIDMMSNAERKVAGVLVLNVWCSANNAAMPEDIEKRLIELIDGAFYTCGDKASVCAIWVRSDAFMQETTPTTPEVFGTTLTFDLMAFPEQLTTDPDPVQALNTWTRENFPETVLIAVGDSPPIWKPTDGRPAVYWRIDGVVSNDRQNYSVAWFNGQFACHVIARSVADGRRLIKAIIEEIQTKGEVLLHDGSPMFVTQITARSGADPLREGQILLAGRYGVLKKHKKELAAVPLKRINFSDAANQVP
jgi:hypothetical protein